MPEPGCEILRMRRLKAQPTALAPGPRRAFSLRGRLGTSRGRARAPAQLRGSALHPRAPAAGVEIGPAVVDVDPVLQEGHDAAVLHHHHVDHLPAATPRFDAADELRIHVLEPLLLTACGR